MVLPVENIFQLIERRLDNVVFRLGFAGSRSQARQIVSHGHILVNGKKVNIPSYSVKPDSEITIKEEIQKSYSNSRFIAAG